LESQLSKVAVIGLGYIGLPTAAVLAVRGHEVLGVDDSEYVVKTLKEGGIHIVEPELDVVVSAAIKSEALKVSTQVAPADVFIVAVPTPFVDDHKPDLSFIHSATESIAPHLNPGNLVILESTSPVGATEKMSRWLSELRPDLKFPHTHGASADINVAHCPERVLPGKVMKEIVGNDRVVGGISVACTDAAIKMYKTFVQGECLATNAATAEMTKLTENSFRDVNIAFANELSILAEEQGVDVWDLIKMANRHPRVDILQPGPGVGGHCIAVDPWFLVDASPNSARLIRQARMVNDAKPDYIVRQVKNALAGVADPVVACLGLAFKANIDDLRESPAISICEKLALEKNINMRVVEPHIDVLPEPLSKFENIVLDSVEDAITAANVVLLLVDHTVFKEVPASVSLKGKVVIDTRGQWRWQ
jgi:UDP-N-acetyl-D-mannosaminuronic acid dehydrogenase